jgi:hypothetical protein
MIEFLEGGLGVPRDAGFAKKFPPVLPIWKLMIVAVVDVRIMVVIVGHRLMDMPMCVPL